MNAAVPADRSAGVGIEALELFVEVLAQSEQGSVAGDVFYDRLCEAVCRLARMRRAVIFRYDAARRRVRAAGAHGVDIEQFAGAHVTVESAPIASRALAEDRVIEVAGDVSGQVPAEYAALFAEPVRLVCAPMAAAGRAIGVIMADRLMSTPALDDAEAYLLWTLGKAAALASVARIVATHGPFGLLKMSPNGRANGVCPFTSPSAINLVRGSAAVYLLPARSVRPGCSSPR